MNLWGWGWGEKNVTNYLVSSTSTNVMPGIIINSIQNENWNMSTDSNFKYYKNYIKSSHLIFLLVLVSCILSNLSRCSLAHTLSQAVERRKVLNWLTVTLWQVKICKCGYCKKALTWRSITKCADIDQRKRKRKKEKKKQQQQQTFYMCSQRKFSLCDRLSQYQELPITISILILIVHVCKGLKKRKKEIVTVRKN